MEHRMTIAGLERDLPICKVTDDLYIAGFVIFGDPELTVACAAELLKKAPLIFSAASAIEPETSQPLSPARASASSLRSNARTACPALTRFAAIPPPMLPSPMKAIFMV